MLTPEYDWEIDLIRCCRVSMLASASVSNDGRRVLLVCCCYALATMLKVSTAAFLRPTIPVCKHTGAIATPNLLPFAVAWNEISAIHEQHIALMAEKWQACLAVEKELSSLELEHGSVVSELRSKWDASLDELEASAAAQLKNLETKLLAKRKKGCRKRKDPAVMQQLLDALL